jgi:hypothetical protein
MSLSITTITEEARSYQDKLNTELWNGLDKIVCQDKIREKSENIGQLVYRVHNVLKNRARRRRRKAHYFSEHA